MRFRGRTQVRALVELSVFGVLAVVGWATGTLPTWLGAAVTVLFGALVVVGLVGLRRTGTGRLAARLDVDGITVVGARTVPWTDLTAVVVGPQRPRWLVGARRLAIVSFLPRPGIELPGPPQPSGRPLGWAMGLRERFYGTNLLLAKSALVADPDEIADAAHDIGGLPVRHERFRGFRDWGIALLAAVVLGVGIAVVRHVLD